MKAIWEWLVKNVPNIFSVIGIVLTIYFGAFYVPQSLRDAEKERIDNAEKGIIQSIKEMTYTDSTTTYENIRVLVLANEELLNEKLPHDINSLLTIAEGSFMEDKFLPLAERKRLVGKIERIKIESGKSDTATYQKAVLIRFDPTKYSNRYDWSWLLTFASALVGLLSIVTIFIKNRKDRENEEEVKNDQADVKVLTPENLSVKDYERKIADILRQHNGVEDLKMYGQSDMGFDIEFRYQNTFYFVEIKYLQHSNVGLKTIERFINNVKGNEGVFWFVYNTDLTSLVRTQIKGLQNTKTDTRKIELVRLPEPNLLKEKIKYLLG